MTGQVIQRGTTTRRNIYTAHYLLGLTVNWNETRLSEACAKMISSPASTAYDTSPTATDEPRITYQSSQALFSALKCASYTFMSIQVAAESSQRPLQMWVAKLLHVREVALQRRLVEGLEEV